MENLGKIFQLIQLEVMVVYIRQKMFFQVEGSVFLPEALRDEADKGFD